MTAYRHATGTVPDYPAVQAVAAATPAVHCAGLATATATDDLWPVAAGLRTSTLFGAFAVDDTGTQTAHRMTIVSWRHAHLAAA